MEEIVGRPSMDVMGNDAVEILSRRFERVLAGDRLSFEEEVSFAGIGSRWCAATYTPTFDAIGVVNGWVAVVVDITERKLAVEDQLQHAAIVESTDDAIISATVDARIVSWNKGAQKLFGYTESEALGQPIEIIVPDDRYDEAKDIQRRVQNGEPIEHYETVRTTKQGKRLDISVTISPIRNSKSEIVGAC